MKGIWAELGIAAGSDRDAIRRAYARKLRITHPEDDPDGFKRLRAAYETALAQADHAARWGDVEDEDEDGFEEVVPSERTATSDPLDRPEATSKWHETTSERHENDTEATALRTARDTDLAALHRAMADLDSALRGVWRAPDAEIEALFAQLLAAPALGEIAVREDIERAVARLIADTIPRSDAILAQAVAAFGWNDRESGRRDYAVYEALQRLEEWRLIAAFGKPRHALHAAWRTLTRKPDWQPKWRIAAFSGSLVHSVRTLLGEFEPVSPGLHFSFDAASVERWRAFLAKPRLTGAMLMLALAMWIGGFFALGAIPALHDGARYAIGSAVAVFGLAAPWIALRIVRTTHRLEEAGGTRSALFRLGWAGAFAALALAAILLPPLPATGVAVMATALLLLGWIVVAADPAVRTPFWPALGRWLIAGWLYAVFGIPAVATLPAPIQLMLGPVAVLAVTIRAAMVEQVRRAIDRIAPRRALLIVAGVLIGIAMLGILATWARVEMTQGVDAALFVGVSLTLLAVLPGLALIDLRYRRWVFCVHIILALVFVSVAAPLVPPSPESGSAPRKPAASLSSLFATPTPASVLAGLITDRPDLGKLERGNPAAYRQIQLLTEQRASGRISPKELEDGIGEVLQTAYRARIDTAPSALIAEERRVKLLQLQLLRTLSVAACARGDMKELETLPDPVWKRTQALVIATAATAPASKADLATGKPVPWTEVLADTGRRLNMTSAAVDSLLASKSAGSALCDARIAVLEALLTHNDADIGATVRLARKAESRRR